MHKIKHLRKLRYEPQDSEVSHDGSMGINAKRVNPDDFDTCVIPEMMYGGE
jgi:hypothetical protein